MSLPPCPCPRGSRGAERRTSALCCVQHLAVRAATHNEFAGTAAFPGTVFPSPSRWASTLKSALILTEAGKPALRSPQEGVVGYGPAFCRVLFPEDSSDLWVPVQPPSVLCISVQLRFPARTAEPLPRGLTSQVRKLRPRETLVQGHRSVDDTGQA